MSGVTERKRVLMELIRNSRECRRFAFVSIRSREGEPPVPVEKCIRSSRRDKMAEFTDAMGNLSSLGMKFLLLEVLLLVLCFGATVGSPPQIVPVKQLDDIRMGERVILLCAIRDGTPPISFSWRKDGVAIVPDAVLEIVHTNEYQETLQIASVSPEHVGNYTCAAKNAFGSDQMSVAVLPRYKPIWTNPNVTAAAAVFGSAGQTASFDCSARGQPIPSISLFRGMFLERSILFWS